MKRITFFLLFYFYLNNVYSQFNEFEIRGKVIDTINKQQFYNIILYNKTKNKGYFGSPDGSFNLKVKSGDVIIVSVEGYERSIIEINNLNDKKTSDYTINLKPKTKQLKTVVIQPLKTIQQIKEEREQLALKESIKMTEGISVIQSPITALYERYSKRAQTKNKINELKYHDKKNKILKELLSLYVSYDIIDLNDTDFDSFVSYLNLNNEILINTSDIELTTFIKDKFEHYKSLNQK